MFKSSWVYKLFICALGTALVLGGLPLRSTRAQDGGLSGEEITLLLRALAGIRTINQYASYETTSDLDWDQEWVGIVGDQAVQGQKFVFVRHEQSRSVAAQSGSNISQVVAADQTLTAYDTQPQHYSLDGEVRLVDGQTYVKAAYAEPVAGAPEVPDGWYPLTDASGVETWPGLSFVVNPSAFLSPEADAVYRLLNVSGSDLPPIFDQYVRSASSAPGTLDDGTPVEVITLTLDRDGALALQTLGLDLTQPVLKMIFEAISGDPLTLNVLLDQRGRLIGLDYTLAVELHGLDMSWLPNVPADFTLDVTLNQTFSARCTSINAPLELVAAPDLRGQAALSAYNVPQPPGQTFWWNDRTFYEIFVRSFYDSNGDGIGDLRGVIEKLDYLNDGDPATTTDLGVTGLWLMPIMQSPSYHGYDVTDYFTVEDDYGTNQDFKDLMEAAHARGMVVIVDLVLNHTSTENPWFVASSAGDLQYANWYLWSDTDPGTLSPWGSQTWYADNGRYYYGLFWSGMPDLNYNTPAVTDAVHQITQFWLQDMGADGFRLDAIRHLFEDFDAQPPVLQNAPATLQWLTGYHEFVKSVNPDALMVGEVWDISANIVPYVGDKVDIAFEFDLATAIITAAQSGSAENLLRVQNTVLKTYPFDQYATFLTNHDQNRVLSQLASNKGAAKVAATILLTGPGVPFVYYGEEVGMQGTKPDERIRTPMQWDDSKPAGGFSLFTPWETMAIGYNRATVAGETDDPGSLLSHYRNLIHLRQEHPALRTGTIQLVESTGKGVYSFLRYGEDETLLIVINLAKKQPAVDYTLTAAQGLLDGVTHAELLFGEGAVNAPAINEAGGFIDYVPLAELPPQSSYVIRLY